MDEVKVEKTIDLIKDVVGAYMERTNIMRLIGVKVDHTKDNQENKIYFTYPESYSEDCTKNINVTIKDENIDIVLEGDPVKPCTAMVKSVIINSGILSLYTSDWSRESDKNDILEILDIIAEDPDGFLNSIGVQFFAKPRKGEVWTEEMAKEAYEVSKLENDIQYKKMIDNFYKKIDQLKEEEAEGWKNVN